MTEIDFIRNMIEEQYKRIVAAQAHLAGQLRALQALCPHEAVVKEHKSNTGNYDPSADSYWTEFRCPDCGKFWSEDGSK